MKKRNLLIIIYLRVILSFVYFLSATFQKKERDKKAARRLRGLNPSRPAAKPQEITLQTMLRVRNASRRGVIQFSKQQSILPYRIPISIVHYNLTRAAPFTYMKHCCGVISYSLNDSLFISPPNPHGPRNIRHIRARAQPVPAFPRLSLRLFFGEIFEQSFAHFPRRHGKRRARRLL